MQTHILLKAHALFAKASQILEYLRIWLRCQEKIYFPFFCDNKKISYWGFKGALPSWLLPNSPCMDGLLLHQVFKQKALSLWSKRYARYFDDRYNSRAHYERLYSSITGVSLQASAKGQNPLQTHILLKAHALFAKASQILKYLRIWLRCQEKIYFPFFCDNKKISYWGFKGALPSWLLPNSPCMDGPLLHQVFKQKALSLWSKRYARYFDDRYNSRAHYERLYSSITGVSLQAPAKGQNPLQTHILLKAHALFAKASQILNYLRIWLRCQEKIYFPFFCDNKKISYWGAGAFAPLPAGGKSFCSADNHPNP